MAHRLLRRAVSDPKSRETVPRHSFTGLKDKETPTKNVHAETMLANWLPLQPVTSFFMKLLMMVKPVQT
jgi:hypothetical protein